jgi:hypothetical protein
MSDKLYPWQEALAKGMELSYPEIRDRINHANRLGKLMVKTSAMLRRSMRVNDNPRPKITDDLPEKSELYRAMFDSDYKPMKYKHKVYSMGSACIDGYWYSFDELGDMDGMEIDEVVINEIVTMEKEQACQR